MKKTLIALAALAATGATFAQATISGQLGLSWQQSPVIQTNSTTNGLPSDGSHIQGLSMNDGEIYISATEDLGGGMSATARGGFTMRGRGSAIMDRDATISLKGGFGALSVGSVRSCGSLVAVQSGVVTGTVYSGNESNNFVPLDKCSMVDIVGYSMPVGPVVFTAMYGEFASSVGYNIIGATAAAAGVTSGAPATAQSLDSKGNVNGVTFTDVAAVYSAGPIMAGVNITTFAVATNKADGALSPLLVPADGVVRTRVVGTYDAGLAKFGLGYQNKTGGSADQYVARVAVPLGNTVVGLDYTARLAQGTFDKGAKGAGAAFALSQARDGDKASSSIGVGATYNFSKSTSLNASYITYTDAGANTKFAPVISTNTNASLGGVAAPGGTTPAQLDTEYRIRLLKSF